jgi:hypothetical protein
VVELVDRAQVFSGGNDGTHLATRHGIVVLLEQNGAGASLTAQPRWERIRLICGSTAGSI